MCDRARGRTLETPNYGRGLPPWLELVIAATALVTSISSIAIAVSSIPGGTQVYIGMAPANLRGVQAIKVRSGTKVTPVNQGSTVNLTLVTRLVRGFP